MSSFESKPLALWCALCAICLMVPSAACSVPDLRIVETERSRRDPARAEPDDERDAAAQDARDGGEPQDAASEEPAADRGTGKPIGVADAGSAGRGASAAPADAGAPPEDARAPSDATPDVPSTEPAPTEPASPDPTPTEPAGAEPNPCVVWVETLGRGEPPANAVEGGLETTLTVPSRQYVCRARPPDHDVTVPGKAMFGRGCWVAYRQGDQMKTYMVPSSEPFELLTTAPGCTFSWQSATNSTLPARAIDLGDPLGGRHYACHGYYQGAASSGIQIGAVTGANDDPPHYECYFESYWSALQPQDPARFEVLAQD